MYLVFKHCIASILGIGCEDSKHNMISPIDQKNQFRKGAKNDIQAITIQNTIPVSNTFLNINETTLISNVVVFSSFNHTLSIFHHSSIEKKKIYLTTLFLKSCKNDDFDQVLKLNTHTNTYIEKEQQHNTLFSIINHKKHNQTPIHSIQINGMWILQKKHISINQVTTDQEIQHIKKNQLMLYKNKETDFNSFIYRVNISCFQPIYNIDLNITKAS